MAEGPTDKALREAALNRGFRLVKSRVKTPGKGDFGKFGLIDAKTGPVFGHDGKTLTATAEDIADYLRKGEVSTWAASIETAASVPAPKRAPPAADEDVESVLRPRKARRYRPREQEETQPRRRPSSSSSGAGGGEDETDVANTGLSKASATKSALPRPRARHAASNDEPSPTRRFDAVSRDPAPDVATPAPVPAVPVLKVRKAARDDAEAITALIALIPGDADADTIAASLSGRRGVNILVAERGGVIGVVAWSVIPTLQRGRVGRITAIIVAEHERRSGVGRALFEATAAAMRKEGVTLIEAVSDIEIQNSHIFFRELGFQQTSYRFARDP